MYLYCTIYFKRIFLSKSYISIAHFKKQNNLSALAEIQSKTRFTIAYLLNVW